MLLSRHKLSQDVTTPEDGSWLGLVPQSAQPVREFVLSRLGPLPNACVELLASAPEKDLCAQDLANLLRDLSRFALCDAVLSHVVPQVRNRLFSWLSVLRRNIKLHDLTELHPKSEPRAELLEILEHILRPLELLGCR